MHDSVMTWGERAIADWGLGPVPTVELGSYDVNGSLRPHFSGRYVGVDIRPGPGVDVVASAAGVPLRERSFGCCVCTEMLEHDARFWLSVLEMRRLLVGDGMVLLSTRGFGFPVHDFPADYWRFTKDAIAELFTWAKIRPLDIATDLGPGYPGVLAIGRAA